MREWLKALQEILFVGHLPEIPYTSSPVIFEKKHNIIGISTQWVMPDSASFEVLHAKFLREKKKLLGSSFNRNQILQEVELGQSPSKTSTILMKLSQQYLDALTKLNPELREINFNQSDPLHAHDIVCGIIYQFNIDDIRYFISDEYRTQCKSSPSKIILSPAEQRVESIFGELFWVASPITLQKIIDQAPERPCTPETQNRALTQEQ